jgi:GT2 family glycosyltransferase
MDDRKAVYAADVRMENGHRQNPHLPFRIGLYLNLLDLSYRWKSSVLMSVAFAFNRMLREMVIAWTKVNGGKMVRIFSAHGSFIILTYQAVLKLSPIFHEDMFLYNEELYLAHRCKLLQIPVYYVPQLKITHLEGASSTIQSNAWKNHEDSYRVLSSWMRDNNFL